MSSQLKAALSAIVARWNGQTSIPVARRCTTEVGGPAFDRPKIPSPETLTTGNRAATLAELTWIRFAVDFIPGTTRPQGLDPSSRTRTVGVIRRHLYYPKGLGSDFALDLCDLERPIFHRTNLAAGLVQCRDTEAPVPIDVPVDAQAGWARLDMATPFWLTEAIA